MTKSRLEKALDDTYLGLFLTGGSLVTEYGVDIGPTHGAYGDVLGPVGHVLMGPFTKQIGTFLHAYIGKGPKSAYEIASIFLFNTLFQGVKYSGLLSIPNVGHDFGWEEIALGVVSGLLAKAYEVATEFNVRRRIVAEQHKNAADSTKT
jgi:hypothetical protein